MAALIVAESIARSEVDVLRSIARAASNATTELAGLRQMVDAVMNLPDLNGLKIQDGKVLEMFGPFDRRNIQKGHHSHTEFVEVKANGRDWGRLALDVNVNAVNSRGQFFGQQLALLLNRLELVRELNLRRAQAQRLSERIETRKILHRASGLVARKRGISTLEALQILVQQARRERRRLNQVAEMVLLGYEVPVKYKPVGGRLISPVKCPACSRTTRRL